MHEKEQDFLLFFLCLCDPEVYISETCICFDGAEV